MTSWKRSPYSSVSMGSKTGKSSPAASMGAASVTAVLDLPGVVEHVPGHPAQDVPRGPGALGRASERLRDHCALLPPVGPRGHSRTRLRRVAALGFHHMASYVV